MLFSSGTNSIISPILHCSSSHNFSKVSHDTDSFLLNFVNVPSFKSFSFLILYVVIPLSFNSSTTLKQYTNGIKSPLLILSYLHNCFNCVFFTKTYIKVCVYFILTIHIFIFIIYIYTIKGIADAIAAQYSPFVLGDYNFDYQLTMF